MICPDMQEYFQTKKLQKRRQGRKYAGLSIALDDAKSMLRVAFGTTCANLQR